MKPLYQIEAETLRTLIMQYRFMIRMMAERIPYNELDVNRASGLAICPLCQLELYEHPTKNGLTLDCSGNTLHL